MFCAANATTELVKLGKTEPVSSLDDHDGGVRNIDTDLDDRRGDEHIVPALFELTHGALLVFRLHTAMEHGELQVGKDVTRQPRVFVFNRFHISP